MKRIALVLVAMTAMLALAVGCGQEPADSAAGTYRQVTAEEAIAMMDSESGYVILDVRTAQEYASGHIPDAINMPVEDIGSNPPAELPDPDQLILVYCRSGNRSKQAAEKLAQMGYVNVVEFGGINTWPGEVTQD